MTAVSSHELGWISSRNPEILSAVEDIREQIPNTLFISFMEDSAEIPQKYRSKSVSARHSTRGNPPKKPAYEIVTCTSMFIASQFTMVKIWKPHRHPETHVSERKCM